MFSDAFFRLFASAVRVQFAHPYKVIDNTSDLYSLILTGTPLSLFHIVCVLSLLMVSSRLDLIPYFAYHSYTQCTSLFKCVHFLYRFSMYCYIGWFVFYEAIILPILIRIPRDYYLTFFYANSMRS